MLFGAYFWDMDYTKKAFVVMIQPPKEPISPWMLLLWSPRIFILQRHSILLFGGETPIEELNWWIGGSPIFAAEQGIRHEDHETEVDQAELRNDGSPVEDVENEEPSNIQPSQSPHSSVPEDPPPSENALEVSTSAAPLHVDILDASTGHDILPFRHNRGKPPNRYSPDEERRKSKYPIANYISSQALSEPLKKFNQTMSSCHVPCNVKEALSNPDWADAMHEELEALKKKIPGGWFHYQKEKK